MSAVAFRVGLGGALAGSSTQTVADKVVFPEAGRKARAICETCPLAPGVDPDIFFAERGGSSKAARSYCARCRVVEECLA